MITKLTLILLVSLLVAGAAIAWFLNFKLLPSMTFKLPFQKITVKSSSTAPTPEIIMTQLPLSEEELVKLWVNGERCPKEDLIPPKFISWGKRDDIIEVNNLQVFVNGVNVNFIDDATCEDAELVAQFINAKINYFDPTTNIYGFEILSRTKEELDTIINKIKYSNNSKIEINGVEPSYPFIKYPPFVP